MSAVARPAVSLAPEIVIPAVTEASRPAERAGWLCGTMSMFGEDWHLAESPYPTPLDAEGVACVVAHCCLGWVNAGASRFPMGFAGVATPRTRRGRSSLSSPTCSRAGERRAGDGRNEVAN